MMVENDHFCLKWQTPFQVGMKLMEVNVSDIISMGGEPEHAFLSMSLTKDTQVEFIEEFYRGLYSSAKEHGVTLLGGDTTHGTEYVFNLTLLGKVCPSGLRLRSMAKVGDVICVTGMLGGSTAGLKLLLKNKSGYLKDHLEPKSRTVNEGRMIASFANAMIDVSDGLGSEVTHICNNSNVGAVINHNSIPISRNTIISGETVKMDPYDFALYGGEDFEIVFTIEKNKINELKKIFTDFNEVGEILPLEKGIYINKNGQKLKVEKGYNHFA